MLNITQIDKIIVVLFGYYTQNDYLCTIKLQI